MALLHRMARGTKNVRRVVAALLCASILTLPVLLTGSARAGGSLDPGFGDGGIVITNLNGSDFSLAVALQPDGKIVTAGTSDFGFVVIRYNNDGTLDKTFNSVGTVLKDFGQYNIAYGVAIQPDGKILAAGYQQNAVASEAGFSVTPLIARYNSDGSPDASFGSAGIATVSHAPVESAKALAVQQDGRIVVAGNKILPSGAMRGPSAFTVSRVESDGSMDLTFGSEGKVSTSFDQVDFLNTIVVQPDGKIVAVGDSGATDTGETGGRSVAIARYNADGSLDRGFGSGGKVVTSRPQGAVGYAAALQADGKLVVTGSNGAQLLLARYNVDGTLDSSFGTGGMIGPISGEGYSVAVQSDGKIVVGGSVEGNSGDDFAIFKFNPDGSADSDFGVNGTMAADLGLSETGRAIAVEPGGRVILAGYVQKDPHSVQGTRFALLAYQPSSSARCMRSAGSGEYLTFSPDGHYKFTFCGNTEMTLSGIGAVQLDGTVLTITDRQPDRVIKVTFDTSSSTGKAKIRMVMPEGVVPFSIKSTNPNAVCSCSVR